VDERFRPLHRDTAALLVIDVQERIDAVMADGRHRPRIALLLRAFAELGVPVLATEQYPKGLGVTVPELAELLPSPPLFKLAFSCAREPEPLQALQTLDRSQIVATGIEAHVCVVQTVLDLLEAGFAVHVPHDAVNSRRARDREWALERMGQAGAVVTSTESVLFELLERCASDEFRTLSRMLKDVPVE
jgi:nicotinamidase-related amidase